MGWNYLPSPIVNGCTVEVCEWICDFVPNFMIIHNRCNHSSPLELRCILVWPSGESCSKKVNEHTMSLNFSDGFANLELAYSVKATTSRWTIGFITSKHWNEHTMSLKFSDGFANLELAYIVKATANRWTIGFITSKHWNEKCWFHFKNVLTRVQIYNLQMIYTSHHNQTVKKAMATWT